MHFCENSIDILETEWYSKIKTRNNARKEEVTMDTVKLREVIQKSGYSIEVIAGKIGINPSTFYRKLKNHGNSFSIGEMHALQEILGLTTEEAISIFLPNNSQ